MARSFESYIDDYDRKKWGAGSSKGTDRFSGLDVRKMFDAGTDKYDLSKRDAAEMVLDYADDIKGKSKMGGGTRAALDKLERYMKDDKEDKYEYEPVKDPEKDPEWKESDMLTEARDRYHETDLSKPENQAPRLDTRYTNDTSKDAISGGDDASNWYATKFLDNLKAEADFGTASIDNDMGYFLEKFVYGPPELGSAATIFDKYKDELEKAA